MFRFSSHYLQFLHGEKMHDDYKKVLDKSGDLVYDCVQRDTTRRTAQGRKDMTTKAELIESLRQFAAQRPGLEFANYGSAASYRAESRRITRQLADARALLAAVESRDSITAENMLAELRGRLTWKGSGLDYCTGQYWPVEYRAAVCRSLSSVLWAFWRDCGFDRAGIRAFAARTFGSGIRNRWFD